MAISDEERTALEIHRHRRLADTAKDFAASAAAHLKLIEEAKDLGDVFPHRAIAMSFLRAALDLLERQ